MGYYGTRPNELRDDTRNCPIHEVSVEDCGCTIYDDGTVEEWRG
jgi:hypothetical protein